MKRLFSSLGLAVLLASMAQAQPERRALTHVNVHGFPYGTGSAQRTVIFERGKIVSVSEGAATAGCLSSDGQNLHLYPTLLDADTLLGLIGLESVRGTHDYREVGESNPDLRADIAFHPDSELLAVACAAGHLVAGVQPRGGLVSGRGSVMKMAGWNQIDMTILSGSNLCIEWPNYALDRSDEEKQAEQLRQRKLALERLNGAFENAKAWLAGPREGQPDPHWMAMAEALEGKRPVFVRAQRLDQIEDALAWSQRQGVRMVLVGGADAWRMAERLAASKVAVLYTETLHLPRRDHESPDTYYRAPALLRAAGVETALSLGGEHSNVRWLTQAAGLAQAHGLSAADALDAVTRTPAHLLGVGDRLGTLEAGKDATFFLCNGDILDGRTKVLRAWIDGVEVDLQTRQRRLYDKYRQRPARP
jgi:imidazolonepropionase-like amidohydrolase